MVGRLFCTNGKKILGWIEAEAAEQGVLLLQVDGKPYPELKASIFHREDSTQKCFEFVLANNMLRDTPVRVEVVWQTEKEVQTLPGFPIYVDLSPIRGVYGEVTRIGEVIQGWARDGRDPSRRLDVEMRLDGAISSRIACGRYREDLQQLGFEEGCYGFEIDVPEEVMLRTAGRLEIYACGTLLRNGAFPVQDLHARVMRLDNMFRWRKGEFFNEGCVRFYNRAFVP